ncbi:MAG: branched-chain amino acid ABC transporter permease [Ilumatobacteraceae bacterium]
MGQVLVNGLFLGCVFAGIAVGLTLVFGVMEVPNFAYSGIIALAAYASLEASQRGWPFVFVVLAGVVVGAVLSVLTEAFAYRWVRDDPAAAPAVALGLLLILQNVALRRYGGEGKALDTPYQGALLEIGNVSLSGVKVVLIVFTACSLGALGLLLAKTSVGRAIRAVAQDRDAAAMLGIPVQQQYTLAFLIAGALGGVTAVAYAPTFQITPYMADEVLLSAFVVVVLGGLGSVGGAIIGGIVLGVVESLGSAYVSSSYQAAFGFVALVVILVFRPGGIVSTNARRVA